MILENNMILIRKAKQSDMYFIGSCHYHCWQETYRGLISDKYLDSMDEYVNINRFIGYWDIIGDHQYIIEEEGKPIGFFDISKAREDYAEYEIQGLYIRKAYHKKGYGRKIIEYIKSNINSPFYLWCLTTNPTCHFYEHMGAHKIATKEVMIGGKLENETCFLFI